MDETEFMTADADAVKFPAASNDATALMPTSPYRTAPSVADATNDATDWIATTADMIAFALRDKDDIAWIAAMPCCMRRGSADRDDAAAIEAIADAIRRPSRDTDDEEDIDTLADALTFPSAIMEAIAWMDTAPAMIASAKGDTEDAD